MDLQVSALNTTSSVCVEGFFGPNCSLQCRFPSYGKHCQLECNCSMELCNHISGCPKQETETTAGNTSETHRGRSVPEILSDKSMWNNFNLKQKAMLISICIMAAVFFVLAGTRTYLTKRTTTSAIISYYSSFRQNQ
uniref:Uncharacterized protein LOC111103303 n=1 Tax=Crassostrea virginica TaxID=6565 RepID=A0A8B8APV1_CRAVI|nr:uncharacterized protein LOC111103303 [Crassostrea virginica]